MEYPFEVYSRFKCGDMTLVYLKMDSSLGMMIVPTAMEKKIVSHRQSLNDTVACRRSFAAAMGAQIRAYGNGETMPQLRIAGDAFNSGYGIGETMRFTASADGMKFKTQKQRGNTIETTFRDARGVVYIHSLTYNPGEKYFIANAEAVNRSKENLELELLSSFNLSCVSPFHRDEASDSLLLHRYHSNWSAEARHECGKLEDYGLEPSWSPFIQHNLRFGQRSSLVVKDFFPTVGIEDTAAGVTWAVQLATVSPWQLEVGRISDFVNLSGGLPDREFAGYRKSVAPGESVTGIPAVITCVVGDMQDALNRLTGYAADHAEHPAAAEADLPLIFNEYCSSWGRPTEEVLSPLIDEAGKLGVGYFVIDAGWFRPGRDGEKHPDWKFSYGDWELCEKIYPHGFDALLDKMRAKNMIPGIWFEFEVCLENSQFYQNHKDWLITFEGGEFDQNRLRRFLDFRKPEVWSYMDEKLIGFLKKHRIGYLKTDYNAALGGVDSATGSTAVGLQELMAAVRDYFIHLKRELPDLTLEVCASGGHRLTAEWMRIGDMASFSDAHEALSIPIIAARTALQIPFRANQVWATLRKGDTRARLDYSLAAGFIGRLCISGDLADISAAAKKRVAEALNFYRELSPILRDGESRYESHLESSSWNHPKGWQIFRRASNGGEMIVVHTFENAPNEISIPATGELIGEFHGAGVVGKSDGECLEVTGLKDFNGAVFFIN